MSAEKGPGDLLELPAFLRARVASQARVIPRIIYQTSKGRYMPASMHAVTRGCFDQNPDYDYRFFGDVFLAMLIPLTVPIFCFRAMISVAPFATSNPAQERLIFFAI